MNQNLPEIEPVHTPSQETPPLPFYHTAEGWMARQVAFVFILASIACTVVGHFGFKTEFSPVLYVQLMLAGLAFSHIWTIAFLIMHFTKRMKGMSRLKRMALALLLVLHCGLAWLSWSHALAKGADRVLLKEYQEKPHHQFPLAPTGAGRKGPWH